GGLRALVNACIHDVVENAVWQEIARTVAAGQQLADAAGGNRQWRRCVAVNMTGRRIVQSLDVGRGTNVEFRARRRLQLDVDVRPVDENDVGQLEQPPPVVPFRQSGEYVAPHDQAQRLPRQAGLQR